MNGIINNGTFVIPNRDKVSPNMRIFGSRFIDGLKRAEIGTSWKIRLVVQHYNGNGYKSIATKEPTGFSFSQRLLLALLASIEDVKLFTRDTIQAYFKCITAVERQIFIENPKELNIPQATVLLVMKTFHGTPRVDYTGI